MSIFKFIHIYSFKKIAFVPWNITHVARVFEILQYGFVNHALELLVLRNYGPEVWEDIKWVSGCVYYSAMLVSKVTL